METNGIFQFRPVIWHRSVCRWDVKEGYEPQKGRMLAIFWKLSLWRAEEWKSPYHIITGHTWQTNINATYMCWGMLEMKQFQWLNNAEWKTFHCLIPSSSFALQNWQKKRASTIKEYYNCLMFSYDKPRGQISAFLPIDNFQFIWTVLTNDYRARTTNKWQNYAAMKSLMAIHETLKMFAVFFRTFSHLLYAFFDKFSGWMEPIKRAKEGNHFIIFA